MRFILFLLSGLLLLPSTGFAASKAADYLLQQELQSACEGRGGRIRLEGFIERDFTGDGRKDLIIAHDAIECDGGRSRSGFCGMQVCTIKIFVRRGPLLQLEEDFLGLIGGISADPVPVIRLFGHGGTESQMQWNGRNFQ